MPRKKTTSTPIVTMSRRPGALRPEAFRDTLPWHDHDATRESVATLRTGLRAQEGRFSHHSWITQFFSDASPSFPRLAGQCEHHFLVMSGLADAFMKSRQLSPTRFKSFMPINRPPRLAICNTTPIYGEALPDRRLDFRAKEERLPFHANLCPPSLVSGAVVFLMRVGARQELRVIIKKSAIYHSRLRGCRVLKRDRALRRVHVTAPGAGRVHVRHVAGIGSVKFGKATPLSVAFKWRRNDALRSEPQQIKYVTGLTDLDEVFRHSWYQSKKFLKWLIEEIEAVEEMIRRRVLSV
ncbi:hypothetical protein Taro_048299 [Colocasia esculenta]|uniref:Uncharacterized protein n=1 Tax=Colocasia esculenta TaxID=4460 RepID=A0A843WVF4_COLES|nr:hypothetical protein [Colocasia esculenta]